MSEDKSKKPKIDLKARLAKTAMGNAGGTSAVPVPVPGQGPPPGGPPMSPSSRPPLAPPVGISPGIPLPPFGQPRAPAATKKPTAAQQTIKVEIGEEIHEERRKASKRTMIYVGAGALVGIIIGFTWGSAKAKGERFTTASEGAGVLEKEVKAAGDKMKELDEKLKSVADSMKSKKFPSDVDLGAINIPFDTTHLDNRGLGGYPTKVLKPLLAYTSAVEDVNKDKDTLRKLLGASKDGLEKMWKEDSDPIFNYAVVFSSGGKGMMAGLVKVKDAFPMGKDWPESFTVLKPERTQQGVKEVEKTAKRWKKGDLTPGGDPVAIPVDPSTSSALSTPDLVLRMSKALFELKNRIEGDPENPTDSTSLLKDGDDLANALHTFATTH